MDDDTTMVFQRSLDEISAPCDFDAPEDEVQAFERGEWAYICLTARVLDQQGHCQGCYSLHGIPERGERGCAFAEDWALQQCAQGALDAMLIAA